VHFSVPKEPYHTTLNFKLSPWNEFWYLVLGVLHGVRGEFPATFREPLWVPSSFVMSQSVNKQHSGMLPYIGVEWLVKMGPTAAPETSWGNLPRTPRKIPKTKNQPHHIFIHSEEVGSEHVNNLFWGNTWIRGQNFARRGYTICILCQVLLRQSNQGRWDGRDITGEIILLDDLGIDGIILKLWECGLDSSGSVQDPVRVMNVIYIPLHMSYSFQPSQGNTPVSMSVPCQC
jgi:hypothetical protein